MDDSAVDPRSEDVRWFSKALAGVFVVVSNVVGAAIVLALAGWVLPTRALVTDEGGAISRNVGLFGAYLVVAVVVGVAWGLAWVRVPAAPAPDAGDEAWVRHRRRARAVVVGAPFRLAVVQAVPWFVAVLLFAGLNSVYSPRLAVVVACVVALGGLATVAVAYRLTEIALRREVARVLAQDPPNGLDLPGVAVRSIGGWVLGTGVPVVGVALIAATSLIVPDYYSVPRLGIVVLVLALIALAVGFLLTALTASSIAHPVVAVRRALGRVEQGDLDVTVPVTDATELGLLQAGFNTMVTGLRERDRIRALFGRQVGEDVAREAMDHDIELGGEVREVAVLFVDLVGSTRMALDRPPHEVVEVLNTFFAEVVDAVEAHHGWINKFEGDAALAVFGTPSTLTDPAGSALAAARDLAARLDALDEVAAGIGVSAGPAVAGNIGDARRYEYTVIGDPVNEAARLTDLAKTVPGCVVASAAALSRAGEEERAHWEVVGRQCLRGRHEETEYSAPGDRLADLDPCEPGPSGRAAGPAVGSEGMSAQA
ncbi:adenylate/guanylate cyclase domain-containing protein [Actinomycetospora termitidis]|uniref:Adenylate/guanylate cyclase domain-containing protein n=1 Tax=Actinomycetospora termitidis TaxID=3053470 RepID=A0ABT7M0Z5_9PSEU|nr:adenylate/guanylate cyclase domain-containing protein [Actinomycetospora sp. Odt1-22]MDL5154336.1 adenylate/guanylate cyclase domain-containing protein [Actinomycetospora sp. Odt1-22]